MSLDKAIASGKEKRKQFRGSKAFDRECRNHGSCEFCTGNRTINSVRKEQSARSKMEGIRIGTIEHCIGCPHCIPVGEGDRWCDKTDKIVIEDYIPNDNYCCCKWKEEEQ